LFGVIVDGTYDSFYWGWVPFVDPNPMLSYFTTDELGNWNDANWSNPEFDALYLEQQQEVDDARRLEIVHQMVRLLYDNAGYVALWYTPDARFVGKKLIGSAHPRVRRSSSTSSCSGWCRTTRSGACSGAQRAPEPLDRAAGSSASTSRCGPSSSSTCARRPSSTWASPTRAGSRCGTRSQSRIPATVPSSGGGDLSAVFGTIGGIIAAWRRGTEADYRSPAGRCSSTRCPTSGSGMLLLMVFAVVLGWFPVAGSSTRRAYGPASDRLLDQLHHLVPPGLTLTLAYLGSTPSSPAARLLDVMGEDYLTVARAKGLRDKSRSATGTPSPTPCCRWSPCRDQLRLRPLGRHRGRGALLVAGLGKATADAIRGPDLPMLQGLFLVFSAAVILFNLLADLAYAWLDPRVEDMTPVRPCTPARGATAGRVARSSGPRPQA
jgi:hypothetical protein